MLEQRSMRQRLCVLPHRRQAGANAKGHINGTHEWQCVQREGGEARRHQYAAESCAMYGVLRGAVHAKQIAAGGRSAAALLRC